MVVDLVGDLVEDFMGDSKADFKQDFEGDLLSSSGPGQVQVRSGPGLVRFSLQIKFTSIEVDNEVG